MKKIILSLSSFLLVSTLAFAAPRQVPGDNIAAFKLEGLRALKGMNLTILYSVGAGSFASTDPRQTSIEEVRSLQNVKKVSAASLEIPAIRIAKSGIKPTFNFIAFVFHKQDDFYWQNITGEWAIDPRFGEREAEQVARPVNTESVKIKMLTRNEYEALAGEDKEKPLKIVLNFEEKIPTASSSQF